MANDRKKEPFGGSSPPWNETPDWSRGRFLARGLLNLVKRATGDFGHAAEKAAPADDAPNTPPKAEEKISFSEFYRNMPP